MAMDLTTLRKLVALDGSRSRAGDEGIARDDLTLAMTSTWSPEPRGLPWTGGRDRKPLPHHADQRYGF